MEALALNAGTIFVLLLAAALVQDAA